MRRLGWVLLVALLAGCGGASAGAPAGASPAPSLSAPSRTASAGAPVASGSPTVAATAPCRAAAPPARWRHVVWVWMENKDYSDVLGGHASSYLSRLAAGCGVATNYHGVTHPSLPNYLAAVSGSTGGVGSDCAPQDCPQQRPTLFAQLAGHCGWATYAESMPRPCDRASSGEYAAKHNPAVYFTALRAACRADDLPFTGFAAALAGGQLPAFTFVVPNLCDDTHDCGVSAGDRWLAQWVPRLLASPAYAAGDTVLMITWDEGFGDTNRVAAVVVSPATSPGTRVATRFDHYSLLASTEDLLGLPRLGHARTAASMAPAFGLSRPSG